MHLLSQMHVVLTYFDTCDRVGSICLHEVRLRSNMIELYSANWGQQVVICQSMFASIGDCHILVNFLIRQWSARYRLINTNRRCEVSWQRIPYLTVQWLCHETISDVRHVNQSNKEYVVIKSSRSFIIAVGYTKRFIWKQKVLVQYAKRLSKGGDIIYLHSGGKRI
jgi:hypothetical protein